MHVFLGRVVENKYYSKTGYIDVILPQTFEEMGGEKQFSKEFDLYEISNNRLLPNYKDGFKADGLTKKCRILSPIGAGEDFGMFHMPQINSIGLVAELSYENEGNWGTESKYIWLGGIYGGNLYGQPLTLPSDSDDENLSYQDEVYYSDNNLVEKFRKENKDTIENSPYINEGMFLIKLKSCKTVPLDDINSSEDPYKTDSIENKHIHYATTPCTNYFIMKKTKTSLRYNDYNNEDKRTGISDLTLKKDKIQLVRIKNSQSDDNKRTEQIQVFDDDKIELRFLNKDTQVDRKITVDNNNILLSFDNPTNKHKVTISIDKNGQMLVNTTADCKFNVGKNVEIKNDNNCIIEMKDKICIKNNYGSLFNLLNNLYNNLRSLYVIDGTGMVSNGQAWADSFITGQDQTDLQNMMR